MKISIKIFGGKEYEKEIERENYEELKEGLKSDKIGFIEVEGSLIKTSQIISIEPIVNVIPKNFRLEEPLFNEKKIRVPGDWQTIEGRKRMEKLWQQMKIQGCFQGFNSYTDWEKIKYAQDKEGLEAINS